MNIKIFEIFEKLIGILQNIILCVKLILHAYQCNKCNSLQYMFAVMVIMFLDECVE